MLPMSLLVFVAGIAAAPQPYRDGVQAQQTGNHRAAVTLFTKSIAGNATHAESYHRRALAYYELSQAPGAAQQVLLDSAQNDVAQALGLDTLNASAHNLKGLVLLAQGEDPEGAVESFTRAIRINPRYVEALVNRARAYRLVKKTPKAIGDLSVAIGLAPHDHTAFSARAALYAEAGQCSLAVGDLTSVLAIVAGPYSPQAERTRAEALGARGTCLLQRDKYEQARTDHRQALSGLGRDAAVVLAHAWADRAAVVEREGRHAAAEELYTQALEFSSGMTLAYAGRARARHALGRSQQALADCDTVLAHNPDSYLDLLLRGQVYSSLGRREDASADFSHALTQARSAGAATDSLVRAIRAMITAGGKHP